MASTTRARTAQARSRMAFGFDLAPLLARSEELAALAQQVAAERRTVPVAQGARLVLPARYPQADHCRDRGGCSRRLGAVEGMFVALIAAIPRSPASGTAVIADEMTCCARKSSTCWKCK